MNFEHLVEINDPKLTVVTPLTRTQLWRGLVVRAERPELSVAGLDSCRILERNEESMSRELRFGNLLVRDRVLFRPMQSVTYETEASENLPAGRLAMIIEEPAPGALFVRFVYSDVVSHEETEDDRAYGPYLKQAYVEADIDTVVTIRRLAGEGLLEGRH